jgi:MSHA biogenesis protein MshN
MGSIGYIFKFRFDLQLGNVAMSLINQVLKDLDKRGASTQIGEATIRVVHSHSRRNAFLLVALGAAGMLVVGGAGWMIWQGQQQPVLPAPIVAAAPVPLVETIPASQPVVAPVPVAVPSIESIMPETIVATGAAQTITLNGSHFREGANVTLSDGEGRMYENRPLLSLAAEQIVLKLNPGKKAGNWLVEVLNSDGTTSGKYAFSVKAPAPAVKANQSAAMPAGKKIAALSASVKPEQAPPSAASQETVNAPGISKQPTQISPQQQAENEFRRAYGLMQQGQTGAAMSGFEAALQLDAGHLVARQTLVRLLIENKRTADAERVLQEGIQYDPRQTSLAMLLARIQVGRNELPQALETMQKSLPYAEKQADYQAFVAALMQRQNRHSEAITYFQNAVQLNPQSGVWLMGLGISLHEQQRQEEARIAFNRALATNTLNAELKAFVTQQLKEL